ncbi:hypothetical protein HY251_11555 [bacterium]|nr:hypothetical protein [bacterium]
MTRHVLPEPLRERWLEPEEGGGELDPALLASRIEHWKEREASFVRSAPFDLEGPGARPTREERGLSQVWFPIRRIARDVRSILRARFGRALSTLDPSWERGVLARAPTWIDARRELASLSHEAFPSRFLERIARDRDAAEALVFEARDPPRSGESLDRYRETLERIAELAPSPCARAWDAGCGSGETTFALACALARGRERALVLGTTPCPFELLMAERRGRPHDRARTLALRERLSRDLDLSRASVTFTRGSLLVPSDAPRDQDVVLVAGVLGGVLAAREEVRAALSTVAGALAPRGTAFVVDSFRDDLSRRAASLVAEEASRAGLRVVSRGELALA